MRYSSLKALEEEEGGLCNICVEPDDCITLSKCGCVYHLECLEEYFISELDQSKVPFICPGFDCGQEVSEIECREMFNGVYLERYLNLLLQKGYKIAGVKKCPQDGCGYAFWVSEGTKSWECL